MSQIVLYDTPYATMWFHPEAKVVHHQVHKFIFGDEFYKFLLSGTEAMKKYKARKWLSDDRAVTVIRPEDMEWGIKNWIPPTVAAGWKYWAIVQPAKALAQMNLEGLSQQYATFGIESKFFSDPDEAMKWLATK
jgi:hypothetical protein